MLCFRDVCLLWTVKIMCMKKNMLIIIGLIFVVSCNNNKQELSRDIIKFNRQDFKEQKNLSNPDTLNISEALNPYFYYIIRDSLVLISNKEDIQPFKCGLYSINGDLICQLAPKGIGPNEFVSAILKVESSTADTFFIEDAVQNKLWIYNVDSVLSQGESYIPSQLNIPRNVISYCLFKDGYFIGYNFWHMDSEKYNNDVPALSKYKMQVSDILLEEKNKFSYFVANVTGARLFTDKKKEYIWALNLFQDRIDIYNDSLKIEKSLSGPDQYDIKYVDINENGVKAVFFEPGKMYKAYQSYTLTDKHIYLLFDGLHDKPYSPTNLEPVEVFKLNWAGELLSVYKLDRFLYSISVDSEEKYLYGTGCESFGDMPDFVRYKL